MTKELDDIVVTLPAATRNMYVDGESGDRLEALPADYNLGNIQ